MVNELQSAILCRTADLFDFKLAHSLTWCLALAF
nr:MAG TPA: hypothetical protein [Caudoviricetes sp.]